MEKKTEKVRSFSSECIRSKRDGKMVQKIKLWDATFVSYRSEIIKTRTEEEAVAIAAAHVEPGERLSQVEEVEGEEE